MSALQSRFSRAATGLFCGYAFLPDAPERVLVVELVLDGVPLRLARAEKNVPDLEPDHPAQGHGFSFMLRDADLAGVWQAGARLANTEEPLGPAILLAEDPLEPDADPHRRGHVSWLGGLRFSGTIGINRPSHTFVEARVEGVPAVRVRPSRWTHAVIGREPRPLRGFDLHLPAGFADGVVRRVHFFDEAGGELDGSPVATLAYADGLRAALAGTPADETEHVRAELFDRLFPRSVPLDLYAHWRTRFPLPPAPNDVLPLAVIATGDGDLSVTEASVGEEDVPVLGAAGDGICSFTPETMGAALGRVPDNAVVVLCPAGARLLPGAVRHLAATLHGAPDVHAAYGDLEMDSQHGRAMLLAFTAFDYERVLEQGYCARVFALRKRDLQAAVDKGAASSFRVLTSLLDAAADGADILHLPQPVARLTPDAMRRGADQLAGATTAHLRERGVAARIQHAQPGAMPALRVARRSHAGDVTMVLMATNPARLRTCIAAVVAETGGNGPILIVHSAAAEAALAAVAPHLASGGVRLLSHSGPLPSAGAWNAAIASCGTEQVCLVHDVVLGGEQGWLDEILQRLHGRTALAAPLTVLPDGMIAGAGLVSGPDFAVAPAFTDHLAGEPGYADMLRTARTCSAVGGAVVCLRRDAFLEVGGFDAARFPVGLYMADLGLRLGRKGWRSVLTPHATVTVSVPVGGGPGALLARERDALRARWGDGLLADRFYSPSLSLDGTPFSALAWPPRAREARSSLLAGAPGSDRTATGVEARDYIV
ncbi:hypothetical protein [Terrihabitans rhizophilus]|uniref:Glycosyltransferase n=1 Tax=Terrihabitans rhizophilus TaxID=3092662 RepID=A0ABU4RLS6_9HYPH|nr:hypothetical protein [Terrihabitans sp. PJ23]MDX6805776.1 hypothetical protein [Terrihabitans sp. PJ23]